MKKIIYSIIVVLTILIAADRILKIYEHKMAVSEIEKSLILNPILNSQQSKDYRKATEFRLLPYTVFGLKPNFKSETVNINSLGFRGPEIAEKGTNDYRIVVIGGSAVFGGETPNDHLTFCKLLEKNLNDKIDNRFEVINAGIPAYISMQELILLEDKVIDLKPDLVIVFDGFNDILTVLKRDKRANYPWWFSEIERIYYTSISRLFIEKRLKKYRPTKLLLNWLGKKRAARNDTNYTINTEQIYFYKRNLDLMCHLAKSYEIDVILVFQPVIPYKNPLTKDERAIIDGLNSSYVTALKNMCDLAKSEASKVAINNNVDFMDGTKFFDGINDNIFLDEMHFNLKGHRIIADLLCNKIHGKVKFADIKPRDLI